MASSNSPYTRDDWNSLVQQVNAALDDNGCDEIDRLPEVPQCHRWAAVDIEEMRRVMEESCVDITFSEDLVKWEVNVVQEIEDQLANVGCDCAGEVPPCANAGVQSVADVYLDTYADTSCGTAGFVNSNFTTLRSNMLTAQSDFTNIMVNDYSGTAWPAFCQAKEALEKANQGGDAGEIAQAQAEFNSAQASLDAVKADLAAKSEITREVFDHRRTDQPSYAELIGTEDPWDESECYCDGDAAGSPARCVVTWFLDRFIEEGVSGPFWRNDAFGLFDHEGNPVVQGIFNRGEPQRSGVPVVACYDPEENCVNATCGGSGDTIEVKFRLRKNFSSVTEPFDCP